MGGALPRHIANGLGSDRRRPAALSHVRDDVPRGQRKILGLCRMLGKLIARAGGAMKFTARSVGGGPSKPGYDGERILSRLTNWSEIKAHYINRLNAHKRLLELLRQRNLGAFVDLLLGISDPSGNYSAAEHHLGPQIIQSNGRGVVVPALERFAEKAIETQDALVIPALIKEASLRYFSIGVGSEASCMLVPSECWVANTRTIWTHLVFKHDGDMRLANVELELYRDHDETSDMAYKKWTEIHRIMKENMAVVATSGSDIAHERGVKPGKHVYLWADAISNALYEQFHR
jgi:hypothetical protein